MSAAEPEQVVGDTALQIGAATLDGHETVIGTVMMLAGENSREVSLRVKAPSPRFSPNFPTA